MKDSDQFGFLMHLNNLIGEESTQRSSGIISVGYIRTVMYWFVSLVMYTMKAVFVNKCKVANVCERLVSLDWNHH